MKRRAFIAGLGGVAATWPLAAGAQQGERVRRVGVLMSMAADDPDGHPRITAFAQGMRELGWAVGRNLQIDYLPAFRYAALDPYSWPPARK
jgi:putative tryptophan/tyrosine transport system substrate-binding protein